MGSPMSRVMWGEKQGKRAHLKLSVEKFMSMWFKNKTTVLLDAVQGFINDAQVKQIIKSRYTNWTASKLRVCQYFKLQVTTWTAQ